MGTVLFFGGAGMLGEGAASALRASGAVFSSSDVLALADACYFQRKKFGLLVDITFKFNFALDKMHDDPRGKTSFG